MLSLELTLCRQTFAECENDHTSDVYQNSGFAGVVLSGTTGFHRDLKADLLMSRLLADSDFRFSPDGSP